MYVVVVVYPHLHACLEVSYFEVMGIQFRFPHQEVRKCPDCFIWNCSYIVYPSKMKGPFRDNCLKYYYLLLAFQMSGWVKGIRRALVLVLVLIARTAIEQVPSVALPHYCIITLVIKTYPKTIYKKHTIILQNFLKFKTIIYSIPCNITEEICNSMLILYKFIIFINYLSVMVFLVDIFSYYSRSGIFSLYSGCRSF